MWKFRLGWMDCKVRAVFNAWKYIHATGVKARNGVPKKQFVAKKVLTEQETFLISIDSTIMSTEPDSAVKQVKHSRSGLYTPGYKGLKAAPGTPLSPMATQIDSFQIDQEEGGSGGDSEEDGEDTFNELTSFSEQPRGATPQMISSSEFRVQTAAATLSSLQGSTVMQPMKATAERGLSMFAKAASLKLSEAEVRR